MRQPRGVRNPQSNDSARTRHTGPTPKRSLNSSMYATFNAVPGRASPRKKADAVVRISFARRSSATSALSFLSSAIASSADCLVSAATVASASLRQRRSDSGAIPGSLATCSIALVSDEYEDRDSVSSLTAFALNSGVYLVPFALVPSSPNQSEEMRNKKQSISPSRTRTPGPPWTCASAQARSRRGTGDPGSARTGSCHPRPSTSTARTMYFVKLRWTCSALNLDTVGVQLEHRRRLVPCFVVCLVYFMRECLFRWDSPWKRRILPWWTMRSMTAAAMSPSPDTSPYLPDSRFEAEVTLRVS